MHFIAFDLYPHLVESYCCNFIIQPSSILSPLHNSTQHCQQVLLSSTAFRINPLLKCYTYSRFYFNKFMPNPFWSSRNLIIFTVCAVHHLTLLRINLSSLGRYRVKGYKRKTRRSFKLFSMYQGFKSAEAAYLINNNFSKTW